MQPTTTFSLLTLRRVVQLAVVEDLLHAAHKQLSIQVAFGVGLDFQGLQVHGITDLLVVAGGLRVGCEGRGVKEEVGEGV